jgi:ribosome-associated heat shock protein Hsp15
MRRLWADVFRTARPQRATHWPTIGLHGICTSSQKLRLDKWLWAARFYKTRSLASEQIGKGRVSVNDAVAKASRELRAGDRVELRQGELLRTVIVDALSEVRGPARVAQSLYTETAESLEARAAALEARRLSTEPGQTIEQGRPTKRDRRKLAEWTRWSASADHKPR